MKQPVVTETFNLTKELLAAEFRPPRPPLHVWMDPCGTLLDPVPDNLLGTAAEDFLPKIHEPLKNVEKGANWRRVLTKVVAANEDVDERLDAFLGENAAFIAASTLIPQGGRELASHYVPLPFKEIALKHFGAAPVNTWWCFYTLPLLLAWLRNPDAVEQVPVGDLTSRGLDSFELHSVHYERMPPSPDMPPIFVTGAGIEKKPLTVVVEGVFRLARAMDVEMETVPVFFLPWEEIQPWACLQPLRGHYRYALTERPGQDLFPAIPRRD